MKLGLGCAALGSLYRPVSDADARATVDAAWDRGIRTFDTAPLYGHGLSEARLGAALAGRPRDEVVLSTKVGRVLVPTADGGPVPGTIFADAPPLEPVFDFTADGVRRSVESSLERLGVDHLDIVHLHDPDDHLDDAVRLAHPALMRLRDEGVVGAIGVGTNHAAVAEHLLDRVELDWVLLAGRITLLDRSGEALAARGADAGVGLIAAGVFNSGLLASPEPGAPFDYAPAPDDVVDRARALAARCERHGVPLAAAAIQHPARIAGVSMVLPGARSAAEVHADVDLARMAIPAEVWAELDGGWS